MSDLISRSALLKEFAKATSYGCGSVGIKFVDDLIKKQPTAYDVDKVVEQMEEEEMPLEDNDGNYVSCVVVPTRVAEMIIRAGGKE